MSATPSTLPTLWRVPNELWNRIQAALVVDKPRKKPGRPRSSDRPIFDALIHLARTGAQWCTLPAEFPPKSTVHDRFQEWVTFGCLEAAWARLLEDYDEALGIEWQWQCADGCIVKDPWANARQQGRLKTQEPIRLTEVNLAQNAIYSPTQLACHWR